MTATKQYDNNLNLWFVLYVEKGTPTARSAWYGTEKEVDDFIRFYDEKRGKK